MTLIKGNAMAAQSSGDILGTDESAPGLVLGKLATQWRGQRYKEMEHRERNRRANRTNQDSLRREYITSAKIFAKKVMMLG